MQVVLRTAEGRLPNINSRADNFTISCTGPVASKDELSNQRLWGAM